ncbi:MAG: M43 family zinc metalloprotease [Bacteroidia bacterium]
MKKSLLPILMLITLSSQSLIAQHERCGTMQHHEYLKTVDPDYEARQNTIDQLILNSMENDPSWKTTNIVTIPVVFHILYSTNNTTQNISNARIQAQLNVLNNDYAATNADTNLIPTIFKSLKSNTGIQFCLAQRDPQGNPTDGIIRKQTTVTSFSTNNGIKYDAQGGSNAWPRDQYLNIWVGNLGSGLLGYAQFPGGAAATDGVVLLNGSVGGPGALGTTSSYNRGRTATHEVGHWLNLRHIWGDATCGNDFVSDTPLHTTANYGCPAFPTTANSCSGSPQMMTMNYMDYTNDACMYMFTEGQGIRMNTCLTSTRAALASSLGCVPVGLNEPQDIGIFIYPNPTDGVLHIDNLNNYGESADVRIINSVGQIAASYKIADFSGTNSIDLSQLKNGIYMVEISSDRKMAVERIVLNK